MIAIILGALVPVFFGLGLGYLAGWTRDVDNTHVERPWPRGATRDGDG